MLTGETKVGFESEPIVTRTGARPGLDRLGVEMISACVGFYFNGRTKRGGTEEESLRHDQFTDGYFVQNRSIESF